MWFVYVKALKGVTVEKWSEEYGDFDRNGQQREFLQKMHLPEGFMNVSLEALEKLYPYEGKEDVV